jgi:hypothetical protein
VLKRTWSDEIRNVSILVAFGVSRVTIFPQFLQPRVKIIGPLS